MAWCWLLKKCCLLFHLPFYFSYLKSAVKRKLSLVCLGELRLELELSSVSAFLHMTLWNTWIWRLSPFCCFFLAMDVNLINSSKMKNLQHREVEYVDVTWNLHFKFQRQCFFFVYQGLESVDLSVSGLQKGFILLIS